MQLTRQFCVLGCLLGTASFSFAQASVNFKPYTSNSGQTPGNVYSVDLNNDGITDLVQDTGEGKAGFTVSLGNGDGTFKAPVLYSEPSGVGLGTAPLVLADFNNDGKVDVAAVQPNNQIAVFLGNGDGTFQSPKLSSITLPSGWIFGSGGAAVGDFNGDGKEDIVAWTDNYQSGTGTNNGVTALYVLQGDGAGGFSTPRLVLNGPQWSTDFHVFVGDFDADGKADLAVDPYTSNSEGNVQTTTVHVLYGNGDFTFDDTTPLIENGDTWISVGDLNSDGLTDIAALNGGYSLNQSVIFLYGTTSRTFKTYSMKMPNGSSYVAGASGATTDRYFQQLVMGDFNGDGHMDLVALALNNSFNAYYLDLLLGTGTEGQFTGQLVQLPVYYMGQSNVVTGLFGSGRMRPDVAVNLSPNDASPPYNTPSYIISEVNQDSGWFGPCQYPHAGQGFDVCAAGTPNGSYTMFKAAASSFGNLRKIELWVDGKKVHEEWNAWEHHAYFQWEGTFAAGTHNATFYAGDVDNRLQRYDFTFTVGGGSSESCSAPSSYGVHVCSPVSGSTVNSPVQVTATGKITGTFARINVWVDGVKKYTESTSLTANTSIALGAGKHRFDIYAENTAGNKWETTVYATVP